MTNDDLHSHLSVILNDEPELLIAVGKLIDSEESAWQLLDELEEMEKQLYQKQTLEAVAQSMAERWEHVKQIKNTRLVGDA